MKTNKTYKSKVVELFGIKYNASHYSLSSINNKYYLMLAEVKYFTKYYLKKAYKLTLQSTINYLLNNYEQFIIETIISMIFIISILYIGTCIGLIIDAYNKCDKNCNINIFQIIFSELYLFLCRTIIGVNYFVIIFIIVTLIIQTILYILNKIKIVLIEFNNKIPNIEII
jgi:hypothetical protein